MSSHPDLSFELLHLISVLSNRIDIVFKRCGLSAAQMYTLVYINSHGRKNRQNKKIIRRARFTNILKRTFVCNKDQVSDLLRDIYDDGLIDDFFITKEELETLFDDSSGLTRVLSITNKGVRKVAKFGDELRKLHHELMQPKSSLLCPPDADNPGILGNAIPEFLVLQAMSAVPKI